VLRELRRLFSPPLRRWIFVAARITGIPFYGYQLDGRFNQVLSFPETVIRAGYEVRQSIRALANLTTLLSAGWLFHPGLYREAQFEAYRQEA
jgi:hypothetical protein